MEIRLPLNKELNTLNCRRRGEVPTQQYVVRPGARKGKANSEFPVCRSQRTSTPRIV